MVLLGLLVLAAFWQVQVEGRQIAASTSAQKLMRLDSADNFSPCVEITYPQSLLVQPGEDVRQALTIRLLPSLSSISRSGQNSTAHGTTSVSPGGQISAPISSSTQVTSPGYLPAPAGILPDEVYCRTLLSSLAQAVPSLNVSIPLTFVVTIDAGPRLSMRRADGVWVAGGTVVDSMTLRDEGDVLSLAQPSVPWGTGVSEVINFVFYVIDGQTQARLTASASVAVKLETVWSAAGRVLGKNSLSTAIAIWIAFLPIYAGFVDRSIRKREAATQEDRAERDRQYQSQIEASKQRIRKLSELRHSDIDRFDVELHEVLACIENGVGKDGEVWGNSEVQKHFQDFRDTLEPYCIPFLRLVRIAKLPAEQVHPAIDRIGTPEEIAAALEWGILDSDFDKASS